MNELASQGRRFEAAEESTPKRDIVWPESPLADICQVLISTVIEIDLRQPSMLHGKKGFERVVWAFNNVLVQSVAWLFYDLNVAANGMEEGLHSLSFASRDGI